MTLEELSKLYNLKIAIERNKRELKRLRTLIGPKSQRLTGMPHGSKRTSSDVERIAAEITDMEAIIKAEQLQCIHEQSRLERYIHGIDDTNLQLIFRLRFVDGFSWEKVAIEMGNRRGIDAYRMQVQRYIKEHEGD